MLDGQLIGAVVLLALVGSLHCVGMCSGFVLLLGRPGKGSFALYVLGKSLSYAVLGLSVAAFESWAHATSAPLGRVFAGVAGIVMLAAGGHALLRRGVTWKLTRLTGALQGLRSATLQLSPKTRSFTVGCINGCVPCGLSWSALALCVGHTPASSAVAMLLFGLATGASLGVFALGWLHVQSHWRTAAERIAGLCLLVFGVLALIRAATPAASCCID